MKTVHPVIKGFLIAAVVGISGLTFSHGLAQEPKAQPKDPAIQPAKEQPKEQPKDKVADETATAMTSLVRAGYTRPGNPDDRINAKGEIVPATLDPEIKDLVVGATIYFSVFKLPGAYGNIFESDLAPFSGRFREGRSFLNGYSPGFDTKGKYLYLYQIVNDRGLEKIPGREVATAALGNDLNTSPISSFSLKLIVDPRYITSWGYFENTAFTATVADRNVAGAIVPAADGAPSQNIRLAISADSAVEGALPDQRFTDGSPIYPLGDLRSTWRLGPASQNLTKTASFQDLSKRRTDPNVRPANWEVNMVNEVDAPRRPDFVHLFYEGFESGEAPTRTDVVGYTIFRVDFRDNNTVNAGERTVVFGFTSDLPPTDQPIKIEGAKPKNVSKEMPVAFGETEEEFVSLLQQGSASSPTATGSAPTPIPSATPSALVGSSGLGGGGLSGGGGAGGGSTGAGVSGGSIGTARPPVIGSQPSQLSGDTGSAAGANQTQSQDNGVTINFNAKLTNTQSQSQWQSQHQSQNQHQNNGGGGHGNVVPEPGSIILAMFGLPALYFYGKRKRSLSAI